MPTNSNRKPNADHRRALQVLAASPHGCTEALMLAHGFTLDLLAALVSGGLATAHTERMRAGKRTMDVARVKITEAGRRMLAGMK